MPSSKSVAPRASRNRQKSAADKKKADHPSKKIEPLPPRETSFPIQVFHELIEKKLPGRVIKPEAAVFFTSVMEYLGAEILELTSNAARSRLGCPESDTVSLQTGDVHEAIMSDDELKDLLDKCRAHY